MVSEVSRPGRSGQVDAIPDDPVSWADIGAAEPESRAFEGVLLLRGELY